MRIVAKTDRGQVRSNNEDAYAEKVLAEDCCYAVVCDGMGGHSAGEVASAAAVAVISERLLSMCEQGTQEDGISDQLTAAISEANGDIYRRGQEDEALSGMGTTVVAVLVKSGTAHISSVGDSRVYLFQDQVLQQLTHDHSYVQTLVDTGHISAEEALTHPGRNMITRALGLEKQVQVDYKALRLVGGEVLLLCTDGLTNFVSDEVIAQVLRESLAQDDFAHCAERLLALANENGGGDNITAVAIHNDITDGSL